MPPARISLNLWCSCSGVDRQGHSSLEYPCRSCLIRSPCVPAIPARWGRPRGTMWSPRSSVPDRSLRRTTISSRWGVPQSTGGCLERVHHQYSSGVSGIEHNLLHRNAGLSAVWIPGFQSFLQFRPEVVGSGTVAGYRPCRVCRTRGGHLIFLSCERALTQEGMS